MEVILPMLKEHFLFWMRVEQMKRWKSNLPNARTGSRSKGNPAGNPNGNPIWFARIGEAIPIENQKEIKKKFQKCNIGILGKSYQKKDIQKRDLENTIY